MLKQCKLSCRLLYAKFGGKFFQMRSSPAGKNARSRSWVQTPGSGWITVCSQHGGRNHCYWQRSTIAIHQKAAYYQLHTLFSTFSTGHKRANAIQPRNKCRSIAVVVATVVVVKAKFHYAILVADRSEAGRRQVRSWSQTFSELKFGPLSSTLAAS